jgi:hypothetical protein
MVCFTVKVAVRKLLIAGYQRYLYKHLGLTDRMEKWLADRSLSFQSAAKEPIDTTEEHCTLSVLSLLRVVSMSGVFDHTRAAALPRVQQDGSGSRQEQPVFRGGAVLVWRRSIRILPPPILHRYSEPVFRCQCICYRFQKSRASWRARRRIIPESANRTRHAPDAGRHQPAPCGSLCG